MVFVLVLIIIWISWLAYAMIENNQNIKSGKCEVYDGFLNAEYFGGFEDLGYAKCTLYLYSNRLELITTKGHKSKTIMYEDIEYVKPISTTEIKEVPSLSKVILFGGLGLLGKGKEKHIAVDYVLVCGKEDKFNVLFKLDDRQEFINKCKTKLNNFKKGQL